MVSLAVSFLTAVVISFLVGLWTYPAVALANDYLNSTTRPAYPSYILTWTYLIIWVMLGFYLATFAVGDFL